MNIEIYSKDNCSQCEMAISKASQMEASYTVLKLGKDFSREELFEQFPTARTFPQIKIDGKVIGGWDAFKAVV